MHLLPHPVPAAFCFDDRLVKKVGQIIDVRIGAQNHIAAASAIAAIRSALGHKFLASETYAAAPAASGLRKNFDPIDKHWVRSNCHRPTSMSSRADARDLTIEAKVTLSPKNVQRVVRDPSLRSG